MRDQHSSMHFIDFLLHNERHGPWGTYFTPFLITPVLQYALWILPTDVSICVLFSLLLLLLQYSVYGV